MIQSFNLAWPGDQREGLVIGEGDILGKDRVGGHKTSRNADAFVLRLVLAAFRGRGQGRNGMGAGGDAGRTAQTTGRYESITVPRPGAEPTGVPAPVRNRTGTSEPRA